MERDITSARTKAGFAVAQSRGRHGGNSKFDQKKTDATIKLYLDQDLTSQKLCETMETGRATFFKYLNEYRNEIVGK